MIKDRIRSTVATRARVQNFTRLIDMLRGGRMLRDEIGEFLGMSPSGRRKYILELRKGGVIELAGFIDATRWCEGHPFFALTGDEAVIADFLSKLALPALDEPRLVIPRPSREPGRHVHILRDDVEHVAKPRFKIPAPDPLLAHFFGFAGAAA